MNRTALILLLFFFTTIEIFAQSATDSIKDKKIFEGRRIDMEVFGEMTFNMYDWETYTDKNNDIDLNRIVFEPEFHFSDKVKIEMEIEIEHGGTGSTMEFDKFEEFGEFEQEVEKGGEVLLEELELEWNAKKWLALKAGKIRVPVGLVTDTYEPLQYFTTTFNNVEQTLIPTAWYSTGIGADLEFNKWNCKIVIVNALDNSQFSSANWIKRGALERFETVGADAFAAALRIDYATNKNSKIGISGYIGNSTPNRPKEDITDDAYVMIADLHAHQKIGALKINALLLIGNLQNADIISDANRNLSNNLNVKRTPVASGAIGYLIELAYDIFSLMHIQNNTLDVFAGYYYYDSMYNTTGDVFNNPRWERNEIRTGISYVWNKHIAIKSDVTFRTIGIPDMNKETTYTTALAFQF
ncbi:MAG: hypothetical protein H7Y00_15870 [Fimbriimonadaceae bacterium]|nr:hypothetical protein [Chitinophagales bacterium]